MSFYVQWYERTTAQRLGGWRTASSWPTKHEARAALPGLFRTMGTSGPTKRVRIVESATT